ncbi:hypothetical protein KXV92_003297 [Aspergillus fumigatus]|nr:hypothetical protein KXX42_009132 [Aspergillus fumigatus]KAH1987497.1 hypothetical protein KXW88_002809 [Aspergillus fumigatus]KAH2771446.1 hypothetical protein KXV94_003495 [Aspergillus fumigatus]KAH2923948.1 hypothetical protein KXW25_003231 [Aspergillus fumigatus]KAH3150562.1 hypothetical protein KXW18_000019 [Aspergillus fumigatus]
MAPIAIPQFLLPRGIPSSRTLHALTRRRNPTTLATTVPSLCRCASSDDGSKPRVLAKPDKFRPPSHPARRVVPTRNGRVVSGPINYPGPRLSEKEKEEQKTRKYPNMFPPEGTIMYKFLTSRWIHIWIAMGVLTSLATFTFTTNFKHSSPYAHLLPPWSALLTHPIDTIGQALAVFRMHVQHTSMETREKRLKRVEDAEKRRQYRIAHGLEEPNEKSERQTPEVVDDQSPVAVDIPAVGPDEYVDWEGKKRPVKKWLGIW